MSDPRKYLINAQDCLCKAADAPSAELRERWLNLADSWLAMVPKDLGRLAKMFETAERDQTGQQVASKIWH